MIDLHSHILPGMDDGSTDVAMSAVMLDMLAEQGVTTVVATPHFYADKHNPEEFLQCRAEAMAQLPETAMQVLVGAEVAYFDGMSRSAALPALCIGDTKLVLVEMPFGQWTERMVQEICEIPAQQGLQPVLAHVDRYRSQFNRFYKRLAEQGVLFQFNADVFKDWSSRLWALGMFDRGFIHFLGSDCHNLTTRAPKIGDAVHMLAKKRGAEAVVVLSEFSESVLKST